MLLLWREKSHTGSMKSLLQSLQTKPGALQVGLAGAITAAVYLVSPMIISMAPFGFPLALGPVVMVGVPSVALWLLQRNLSIILIVVSTMVAELLVADLNALLVAQTVNNPWLSTAVYLGGFMVVWYGALRLCAWIASLLAARPKHGQSRRAALIAGGVIVLVLAGVAGLHFIVLNRPIYHTPTMSQSQIDERKARILAIYDSLNLGSDYQMASEDVFGEKRVYAWDQGRTFSSSRSYVRAADVEATVAELRPRIEQAGFTYIGEPYPGSVDEQLHFRSAKGEYIRLTVSSKPRDDAVRAAHGKDLDYGSLPTHEGPSNVLIKVNLDDNNE
jgi:hypothetical protein